MGRPSITTENMWWKVDKRGPDECWPWTGPKNERGYGRVQMGNKSYYMHRIIYAVSNPGTIEWEGPQDTVSSQFVRHSCDNPPCCNPAHLLLGTHFENMRDKVVRGRSPDYSKGKGPRCKLTMEDVFWIRMVKKYGATIKALALLYEVSRSTISGCLYGRHYQDGD